MDKSDFFAVGIGVSAGGLEVLEKFFSKLTKTSDKAFIIIQQISPGHEGLSPEPLSQYAGMPACEIEEGMEIAPGRVYLNPPNYNVILSCGRFSLIEQEPSQKNNMVVDTFFESLAAEKGEKAIGIIMSGTGNDGARGCKFIKEAGGIVMVQDVQSSTYGDMPRSVISSNAYDYIADPGSIAAKLPEYSGHCSCEEVDLINNTHVGFNSQPDYSKEEFHYVNHQWSTDLYEKLVDLSPFAILIVKDDIIQFSNAEGAKLFQVEGAHRLVGKPLANYLGLEKLQLVKACNKCDRQGCDMFKPIECTIVRKDGSEIHLVVLSRSVTVDGEDAQLVILRDITYRKIADKLKEDSERNKKLLEEAVLNGELKNDFFGNLSHELRMPLNVIMSTLQLMESVVRRERKKNSWNSIEKYLGIIRQNCYRQLRLINNIIDITKIDSGFYEVNFQNHDIVKIVEDIALSVLEYVRSKSIDLTFDTDVEEKVIACDPDNIERILLNLLSNAIKFSPYGGSIAVCLSDRKDSVLISVKDSGIGIPQDKLGMIFERFRQVDKNLTRQHQGSGIGLSLVKSLVEMHGGTIKVVSELGKGTEFIIELPARTVSEEETVKKHDYRQQDRVDKIHIEFSDIYK